MAKDKTMITLLFPPSLASPEKSERGLTQSKTDKKRRGDWRERTVEVEDMREGESRTMFTNEVSGVG